MGQLIVTAVLASLVAGGGIFIFWPDLSAKLPKRAKKMTKEELSMRDIYRKHYTTTDELIEVASLIDKGLDREFAKEKIADRGDSIVELLANPNQHHRHTCPVCYNDNRIQARIASVGCRCGEGHFRNKVHSMVKEAGYQHY